MNFYRTVLTFVHLSDIHFRARDHGTQFDVDQHIRRALLEDLAAKPANGAAYDGLLITGDIAFAGQKDEYTTANAFLDEVFARTGLSPAQTYVVPGNHDVDRTYVMPGLPLWSSHEGLRKMTAPVEWRDNVSTQLHKDPHQTLLAPLHSYNDFAQGFGCATTAKNLAWSRVFPKPLEDGTVVRLHGLNSALISDQADAPAKLLVTDFQTAHFSRSPEIVELVLCHHPPDWLMDKVQLREALDAFTHVALFGHEHSTYGTATKDLVQLFAGAVQPATRDPGNWLPTYHIIQLSIAGAGEARDLVVHVRTREFSTAGGYRFHPRRNADSEIVDEHRLRLAPWMSQAAPAAKEVATAAAGELPLITIMAPPEPLTPTPAEVAQRELLVQFFRLGTPLRFAAAIDAGLVRDGDDTMDPRVMWEQVFQRAIDEQRLEAFWIATAKHSSALRGRNNPFST